jgi:biotin synthase
MERKVRASLGTLGILGMELVQMDAPPTTAYLQIYTEKRCKANCLFCAQASGSRADMVRIARGMYIPADLDTVVHRLKKAFEKGYLRRACIQTALYDTWWDDAVHLIKKIRTECGIPISLSVFPLGDRRYQELHMLGVNELVIPLDACTQELFDRIKGKTAGGLFSWDGHLDGIKRAVHVFENVGTHLIIGLGETDEEAVSIIDKLHRDNVNIALFSYTYVPGAQLFKEKDDEESIRHYRKVQAARHLIVEGVASFSDMKFSYGKLTDFGVGKEVLLRMVEDGRAFMTSGCPECNRPMANETFSRIYNFPRLPDEREKDKIKKELGIG